MPLVEDIIFKIVNAAKIGTGSFLDYCRENLEELAGRLENEINRKWTGAFLNTYFPQEWFLPTIDEHNKIILPISKVMEHFEDKIFTKSKSIKLVFKIFKNETEKEFNLVKNWSRWKSGTCLPNFETLVSLKPSKPPVFYSLIKIWKSLPEKTKQINIAKALKEKGTPKDVIDEATINWIRFLNGYYSNLGEFKIEHLIGAIFIARFSTAVYVKAVSRRGDKTTKELLSAFLNYYQKQKESLLPYPFSKSTFNF